MIFGTDGIRGVVDKDIDSKLAYNLGKALAIYLSKHKLNNLVLIGRDTRISGDLLAYSVACGLSDYGVDSEIIGIVSTPMVSFLTSKHNYGAGIMITASHNDYTYNGIKCFSSSGLKFRQIEELELETFMKSNMKPSKKKGKIINNKNINEDYINYLLNNFNLDLSDLTIVIDAANGSNFDIAQKIYKHLSANVIRISCSDNGYYINRKCGANHIDSLYKQVKEHNADFGIAFDGDGDRLRIILSNGRELSGEHLLFLFSIYLRDLNLLNNLTLVATIMTNRGLIDSLSRYGIKTELTDVGDKNVIEKLRNNNYSIGGEPSGHICLYAHNTTCDALFNSLFFFKILKETNWDINKKLLELQIYPSIAKNIPVTLEYRKNFDKNKNLKSSINLISKKYSKTKIIVRPSGTEPVIRIYVEGISQSDNLEVLNLIENIIKNNSN